MKTKEPVRIRQAVTNAHANQDGKHSTAMKVSVAMVSVIVCYHQWYHCYHDRCNHQLKMIVMVMFVLIMIVLIVICVIIIVTFLA